jgi:hypothetical protein
MELRDIKDMIKDGRLKVGDAIPTLPRQQFMEMDGDDVLVTETYYVAYGYSMNNGRERESDHEDEEGARAAFEMYKQEYIELFDAQYPQKMLDFGVGIDEYTALSKLYDARDCLDVELLDVSDRYVDFYTGEDLLEDRARDAH